MAKNKPAWKPDFSKLPKNVIGACFNADGGAWAWTVKPELKGSEKRPHDIKWRGPEYGQGYIGIGMVPSDVDKKQWRSSWIDAPKRRKAK